MNNELSQLQHTINQLKKSYNPTELLAIISELILPQEQTKLTTASFKIHPLTLNTLKNIVYTKKTMGFADYTQTKALSEAINLLAQSLPLKNRPASIQKNEQKRSIIIARSIAKRKKQTKETQ